MDGDIVGTTEELKVIIRPYRDPHDNACIYSTWRNQAYYSSLERPLGSPQVFFKRVSMIIFNILKEAKVRIACLQEDPNTIIGYSVSTGDHLNWIYVKEPYRNKGIASLLWPTEIKTVTCYLTKIGAKIADKKKLIFMEKENEIYH
jgi:GNAT superfamily N-acetyltransferase